MSDTNPTEAPTLAELVASRLCHDLVNPIGAIFNGIELLQASMPPSPEIELLAESTGIATHRIRFFRIAFGAASASETVEARVLAEVLTGVYGTGRLEVLWLPQPLHRSEARLMLLAVMCAESALPLGGLIRVDTPHGRVRIAAEGRRTRFETEPWAHLVDGVRMGAPASAHVHFLLARRHLEAAGRSARLEGRDDGFSLEFGA